MPFWGFDRSHGPEYISELLGDVTFLVLRKARPNFGQSVSRDVVHPNVGFAIWGGLDVVDPWDGKIEVPDKAKCFSFLNANTVTGLPSFAPRVECDRSTS